MKTFQFNMICLFSLRNVVNLIETVSTLRKPVSVMYNFDVLSPRNYLTQSVINPKYSWHMEEADV